MGASSTSAYVLNKAMSTLRSIDAKLWMRMREASDGDKLFRALVVNRYGYALVVTKMSGFESLSYSHLSLVAHPWMYLEYRFKGVSSSTIEPHTTSVYQHENTPFEIDKQVGAPHLSSQLRRL